jgi:outer membrane protein TolC
MTDDTMHKPTTGFRDQLERTVIQTYQLEQETDDYRRATRSRLMRLAAVIIVSLGIGATAGVASGQIRDAARRDSLLDAAKADASLSALRLNRAREQFADTKRKYDVGASDATSLASADAELRAMEARAMRARYNIEEITATAQAPRDDLNAPLVGGRDFVKDRIMLDLMAAQRRLTAAEQAYGEAERRQRVGAVSDLAPLEASVEVERARAAMTVLAERLTLRKEFVDRATPIEQLTARLADTQLQQDVVLAQQELKLARERAARLERQRAAGVAGESELLQAKLKLQERELELQQLMLRYKQRSR